MAEEALKKLEEQLNCPICLDTYTDPKLLQCFHIFCRQCLVPLVVRDQQGQLSLTCPTCRQMTPIPADRGVAGLQPAFHIDRLLEVQQSFKSLKNADTLSGACVSEVDAVKHCCEHEEEELKLYCEDCGELVCVQCIMKEGRHHDHDCALIRKAFQKYEEEMASSVSAMEEQVASLEKGLVHLDSCCEEIALQEKSVKTSVCDTFKQLRLSLRARENMLIAQIRQISQDKLQRLAKQRGRVESALSQLNSCLLFVKESLKVDSSKCDVLKMKRNTRNRVKELTASESFQSDFTRLRAKPDIVFFASEGLCTVCQHFGEVVSAHSPDPCGSYIMGRSAEVAIVGSMSKALLQVVDFAGKPYSEEPVAQSLRCVCTSELTGAQEECSVASKGGGRYQVSFRLAVKGRHFVHVTLQGQHVSGSPFSVRAKSPVEELGKPVMTLTGLERPWGIAINRRGKGRGGESGKELVVSTGNRLIVLSSSGEKLQSFDARSFGPKDEFEDLCGLSMDVQGSILVTDYPNHRLLKFSPNGHFLASVGSSQGSGPLQFSHPIDVAYNTGNCKYYVADNCNHRVQVLNADLSFSATFGTLGSGRGQLSFPRGVSCDACGHVYVADSGNHRVQIFTPEGGFVRAFGRRGFGQGELSMPYCLAVDSKGLVFVTEGGNHRVSVFTRKGRFVTSFGLKGKGPGKFEQPRGVAVDASGVLYVCDHVNSSIQLF